MIDRLVVENFSPSSVSTTRFPSSFHARIWLRRFLQISANKAIFIVGIWGNDEWV